MLGLCHSIGCTNQINDRTDDFCQDCLTADNVIHTKPSPIKENPSIEVPDSASMAEKYPKYYKSVDGLTEIDVYAVHMLFNIQDPSGAIQHASKKLLLSGVRTGGKAKSQDIKEARDTLTRWLQLNETHTL